MIQNIIIQEAVEKTFNPSEAVKEIKQCMSTCRLNSFKSKELCNNLYSKFFLCNVEASDTITAEQWGTIYNILLNDNTFTTNMSYYLMLFTPDNTAGLFKPLMVLVHNELKELKNNKVKYLSNIKSIVNMIYMRFDSIKELVSKQVNDPSSYYFITTILSVINSIGFQINDMMQNELTSNVDKNDISYSVDNQTLAEDVVSLLSLLENAQEYYDSHMMGESIINDTKEKAKAIYIKKKKIEEEFDRVCMKKVKELRETRRTRKHAEMVGEALRVNRELKRLLSSVGAGLIATPAVGLITWIVSFFYDRQTDAKDRAILVQQLKDEIEITDEKISQAERNGDDASKIQLMRLKQKLANEYKRITRLQYDPSAARR